MRILTINPGSTSTKVALFENNSGIPETVFQKNVSHDAKDLAEYKTVSDQLPYRKEAILAALKENGVSLASIDAVVGRGGGLFPMEGGTYGMNAVMLEHARKGANGIQHPAQLGPQLAHAFAEECGARAFVVNPPDVDEIQDVARMTGLKGVYRMVHLHALNLKETAIRHAESMGRNYEDCDFVVCHIGGGISVSAHRHGRMIDGYDIAGGEGPMTPTRSGSVSVVNLLNYMQGKDPESVRSVSTKSGGFVSHLGTSDALEVIRRAESGDKYAAMVWESMIYQICKCIGSMAAVLGGKVDGILLGGGMVHSEDLVEKIRQQCEWIAPVTAYPGEFEMEAMASGAIRVMTGREKVKEYTGRPLWTGFDFVN